MLFDIIIYSIKVKIDKKKNKNKYNLEILKIEYWLK